MDTTSLNHIRRWEKMTMVGTQIFAVSQLWTLCWEKNVDSHRRMLWSFLVCVRWLHSHATPCNPQPLSIVKLAQMQSHQNSCSRKLRVCSESWGSSTACDTVYRDTYIVWPTLTCVRITHEIPLHITPRGISLVSCMHVISSISRLLSACSCIKHS